MSVQRAAVLTEPGVIRMEERAVPAPEPGEVLVRVLAVGVCGSDAHYYHHGRIGDFVVEAPIVLGHEVGGEIVEVGEGVDPARIGELVSLEPQRTSPWSEQSRIGKYNLDPDVEFFATPPYDGAFCEYVTIPSGLAYRVSEGTTAEEAALLEPLAVAVAAVRRAGVSIGQHVTVAGAGPIGLLISKVAQLAGATRITVSDPLPEARARALEYGATEVLDPTAQQFANATADVFIDASGVPAAILAGILGLKPAGRALLVGMGPETLEVPFSVVQVREIEIVGVFRYANAWPAAVELSKQIDLFGLITARYGLSETETALEQSGRRDQVKVMVLPGQKEGAA